MKIKGGGPRKSARPAEEPNFYNLPFLPPHEVKKKEAQAVYTLQYQPAQATSPVRGHGINTVLEQALAQQAYANYTAQVRAAPTFAPLPCPPPLPAARSLSQALGYPHLPDAARSDASTSPQLFAAMRENELLTAALLQRLRR